MSFLVDCPADATGMECDQLAGKACEIQSNTMLGLGGYDVGILGGGPAGYAAGLALARFGLRVALVMRPLPRRSDIPQTLAPQTRLLLSQLDAWDSFDSIGPIAFPGIIALWGRSVPSEYDFLGNVCDVGWHINRRLFDGMLFRLCQRAGVNVFLWKSVNQIASVGNGWRLVGNASSSDTEIACRYLVDATGRAAALATRLGAQQKSFDKLVSLTASTSGNEATPTDDPRLLIEAAEIGWWYFSPAPGPDCACVLMTDSQLVPTTPRKREEFVASAFLATKAIRTRFSSPQALRRLTIMTAHSSRLHPVAGRNWLAVGDAAMAWDPLSGQGIYNALATAVRAAEAVRRSLEGDPTAGSNYCEWIDSLWSDYVRQRSDYYRAEGRWPQSVFWRRRHDRVRSASA